MTKLASLFMATIVAFGLAMTSCGNPQQSSEDVTSVANPAAKPVDPATTGSVKGTVTLNGRPPERKPLTMASVVFCAKQHPIPAMTEDVITGKNGALQNVVVYLKGDFGIYAFEQSTIPAELDQKGCVYTPHVIAIMAGTPLEVSTSDLTTHNIHPITKNNRAWNESQAPGSPPFTRSFAREEVAIPVQCNLHKWMKGYVAVLSNPYFQVTGEDGSFELKNVPPGTYTLVAWHEVYGTTEQSLTVAPKQEQTVPITFAIQK